MKASLFGFYEMARVFKAIINSYLNGPCSVNPLTAKWALRALIEFTLSNARRFYSSMGNPLDGKGLTTPKAVPINPLTAERALRALIVFTLSNARRFKFTRQWGKPLDGRGLKKSLAWKNKMKHTQENVGPKAEPPTRQALVVFPARVREFL